MRKYNGKTKKTMLMIIGLFIGIVVIFSLFLKKSIDIEKTVYKVVDGNVLFDNEYNMINIVNDGSIKIKWGGDYYLTYNEENYNLGKNVVVYDNNSGDINLYGKFYEVLISGEVDVIKGDHKIKSSVNSKFYKLADRKYLIIDRVIEDSNSSFTTSNYLIINLDKLGNATLLNNKTSYKTIKPTILRTASFTFDIANEKLYYGDKDIDLKKIIGSTNEYDEETYNLNYEPDPKDEENDKTNVDGEGTGTGTGTGSGSGSGSGNGTGSGDGSGGTGEGIGGAGGAGEGESGSDGFGLGGAGGAGTGEGGAGGGTGGFGGAGGTNSDGTTAGGSSDYNNNYSPGVSDETVQEIINATKNTSVIRVSSNLNSIEVDYVVYDPNKEYKSVYVEVEDAMTGQINTVYLTKTDTKMIIRDLNPNVYYTLKFKYTYNDEAGNLKEYEFDEVGLYTKIPTIYINPVKISNNKLYYKISLDNYYTVTGGTVNLYLNDQFKVSSSIGAKGKVNQIYGDDCYLDLSTLDINKDNTNILELRIGNLNFNTYSINPAVKYKFKY